ncbi:hypothetical protein OAF42_03520 [Planctomicrobium sp.]|nr:hypothetical protein [Planctomicrobium sp.]MDB4733492.1 hypothetical protein [Planctomicrobium sp.]
MSNHMTETLKLHIKSALHEGETYKGLERETGVLRQSLMKFMSGETSLRLDMADKLADHFGLALQPKKDS